jgi:hypothetical protein
MPPAGGAIVLHRAGNGPIFVGTKRATRRVGGDANDLSHASIHAATSPPSPAGRAIAARTLTGRSAPPGWRATRLGSGP